MRAGPPATGRATCTVHCNRPLLLSTTLATPLNFPLGRWNLYVGGAGAKPEGYVNIDLFPLPGVDIAADAEHLPFPSALFQCIECDAVLEHVRNPDQVMRELSRVLAKGGHLHLVTPFCHPFHEYPRDYRRFTPDGLRQLAGTELEVVAEGWRTGPTATMLVFRSNTSSFGFLGGYGACWCTECWAGSCFRSAILTCCFFDRLRPGSSATTVTYGCESASSAVGQNAPY